MSLAASGRSSRFYGRWLLLAISTALVLAALELILRVASPTWHRSLVLVPGTDWTIVPAPDVVPGVHGGHYRVNAYGIRAPIAAARGSETSAAPAWSTAEPYFSAGALDRAMTTFNRTLEQVCRDRDLECIDAAGGLPKDASIFYDDVHFTEAGAR